MVREVKLAVDIDGRRIVMPFGRDSIFDDEPPAERPSRRSKRRRDVGTTRGNPAADRPATDRRHLAGADWLSPSRRRKGK